MDKNYVDTTQTITHIGLCAGYGGIELGLKRVIPNLRSVALCEIEAFACANMVAKMEAGLMEPAPIWSDLKTFPWREFRDRVDILTGGYPCQPFSAAGKRLGTEDPRHLWPFISAGIAVMRPSLCFFENVEGHISLGLPDVIEDLGRLGYRATWGIFSAAEVGAPHQRKRVFILAKRSGERGAAGISRQVAWDERVAGIADNGGFQNIWPSRPGAPQHEWEPPRVVADTNNYGRTTGHFIGEMDCKTGSEGGRGDRSTSTSPDCGDSGAEETALANTHKHGNGTSIGRETRQGSGKLHNESTGLGDAEQQYDSGKIGANELPGGTGRVWARWESFAQTDGQSGQTQSTLGGDINGPASGLDYAKLCESCDNRTDELRLLGNGVVPATAERAFRVLMAKLKEEA